MKYDRFLKAAIAGLALSFTAAAPTFAPAETLRVLRGAASSALSVPMNRAVVVESDVPFAELSIANPGIADISSLSDRTIYVLGKEPGRTTMTLLGADGRLITNVEVHVSPDVAEFKERLTQILPGENIEVRTANDGIVLSGTVSSIARLDRALELAQRYAPDRVSNLMVVGGTQQVMLKVRFAEMQRSVSKALSSSLSLSGLAFNDDVRVAGGTGIGGVGSIPNPDVSGAVISVPNALTSSPDSNGAFLFGFGAGGLEVGILLEALESQGVVRSLAEPNL
ncbi:MAG: pilus assembly protein N-terminal domain-containing protein, partial [Paracoccaceae bacterium]|nr:pilus assembly protein N-terminal domain-containing protein [Paracoccaceae bacterium]